MSRRAVKLSDACNRLLSDKRWANQLLTHAAELAVAAKTVTSTFTASTPAAAGQHGRAATRVTRIPAAGPAVDEVCAKSCSDVIKKTDSRVAESPVPLWAGLMEAILGREPVEAGLLNPSARHAPSDDLAHPLLYFAAAKNDVQAVRLLVALGAANPTATQSHDMGPQGLAARLARPLARLMSKPTIDHQLRFLRLVDPGLFAHGAYHLLAMSPGLFAHSVYH
jgi:hypothetical protein